MPEAGGRVDFASEHDEQAMTMLGLSSKREERNPHRAGIGWALGTVTTTLQNPRYTGHQVWNRQRTDKELADPADVSLGHKRPGRCQPGT
jgi:Recombinase